MFKLFKSNSLKKQFIFYFLFNRFLKFIIQSQIIDFLRYSGNHRDISDPRKHPSLLRLRLQNHINLRSTMEKLLGWIETEDLYNTIEDLKITFFEPQI